MRTPKSVGHALIKKLLDGKVNDEERERIKVWAERTERNLGRKAGRMPKGPLKRLRDAGRVALDYHFLRLSKVKQTEAEAIVSDRHCIGTRTMWNRLSLVETAVPNWREALRPDSELQAIRQRTSLSAADLRRLLGNAVGSGTAVGLLDALDPSAGARLLLDGGEGWQHITEGVFEETLAFLRELKIEVWRQIGRVEQFEELVFVVAKDITIRKARIRAPDYCK